MSMLLWFVRALPELSCRQMRLSGSSSLRGLCRRAIPVIGVRHQLSAASPKVSLMRPLHRGRIARHLGKTLLIPGAGHGQGLQAGCARHGCRRSQALVPVALESADGPRATRHGRHRRRLPSVAPDRAEVRLPVLAGWQPALRSAAPRQAGDDTHRGPKRREALSGPHPSCHAASVPPAPLRSAAADSARNSDSDRPSPPA